MYEPDPPPDPMLPGLGGVTPALPAAFRVRVAEGGVTTVGCLTSVEEPAAAAAAAAAAALAGGGAGG